MPKDPKPDSNEVFIRVKAAAINPVDYKMPAMMVGPVVGFDVAGVVEKAGDESSFKVGDEVFGGASGSVAEFTTSKSSKLAKKPANVSFAQAAALPVAYLTALQGVRDYGKIVENKNNKKILILGASGGCGLACTQLAKKAFNTTEVVGVCSDKNVDTVKQNGADRVINYKTEKIEEVFGTLPDAEKFDIVFDAVTNSGAGEDYKASALKCLRKEKVASNKNSIPGQYVAINGAGGMWLRLFSGFGQKKNEHLFMTSTKSADLEELGKYCVEGTVHPVFATAEPFQFGEEGCAKAYELLKSRRAVGKVVISME